MERVSEEADDLIEEEKGDNFQLSTDLSNRLDCAARKIRAAQPFGP